MASTTLGAESARTNPTPLDAPLLEAFARWQAAESQLEATRGLPDKEVERRTDANDALALAAAELPAHTAEGLAAKVLLVAHTEARARVNGEPGIIDLATLDGALWSALLGDVSRLAPQ